MFPKDFVGALERLLDDELGRAIDRAIDRTCPSVSPRPRRWAEVPADLVHPEVRRIWGLYIP